MQTHTVQPCIYRRSSCFIEAKNGRETFVKVVIRRHKKEEEEEGQFWRVGLVKKTYCECGPESLEYSRRVLNLSPEPKLTSTIDIYSEKSSKSIFFWEYTLFSRGTAKCVDCIYVKSHEN